MIKSYTLCIFHDKKIKMNLKNEYFIEIIKKNNQNMLYHFCKYNFLRNSVELHMAPCTCSS